MKSLLRFTELYSYRNAANPKLNRMASRSLVGSLATLTTSVANLTVLMVLRGEPGWICLMCCNADILFCVLVLHWVTSKDKPSSYASTHASRAGTLEGSQGKRGQSQHHSKVAAPEKLSSRGQYVKNDINSQTIETQQNDPSIWPYEHSPVSPKSPAAAKLSGSVTTEIRSSHVHHATTRSKSRNGRLHKIRDENSSDFGDEVELHKIHVQREICIDSNSSRRSRSERRFKSEERKESVEDAWGIGRSVSAEKMF